MAAGLPYILPLTFSIDAGTLVYKYLKDKLSGKKLKEYTSNLKEYIAAEVGEGAALFTTLTGESGLYGPGGSLYESVGIPLNNLGESITGTGDSFMPYVQAGLLGLMGITAGLGYRSTKNCEKALNILDKIDKEFEGKEGKKIINEFLENVKNGEYKKPVLKKVAKLTENPELELEINNYLQATKKIDFSKLKYLKDHLPYSKKKDSERKKTNLPQLYERLGGGKEPIDLTQLYNLDGDISQTSKPKKDVTIIISAHDEEETIEKSIRNIFEQDYSIKNVYISDSNIGNNKKIVEKLKKEFPNIHYWSKEGTTSKAEKINALIKDPNVQLGYYTYLIDSSTRLHVDVIKKMVDGFTEDNIASVAPYGYVDPPDNYLAKYFHYGKEWANRLGKFRKSAQQHRRATSVVCGASFMVKSDILKKIELPTNTTTEDTSFTWQLQEEGYKIGFVPDAIVSSEDKNSLKEQLKQSYRWYEGTWQNLYNHKKIFGRKSKAKSLAYTSILPGFIESLMYTGAVVSLPITAYFAPDYAKYFLIGDTVLSFVAPVVSPPLSGDSKDIPKELYETLRHYHQITTYKALSSALWVGAGLKVGCDVLTGKSKKWTNKW